jgi:hypothetical protein
LPRLLFINKITTEEKYAEDGDYVRGSFEINVGSDSISNAEESDTNFVGVCCLTAKK